jgi:hypothetical protein
VGLANAPWVGTHNSFNSTAEMGPTLSNTDSNQQLSLVDQLGLDVRSLELDLHWFPSASGGGFAPVVCHARGPEEGHAGCSIEKPLGPVLEEIAGWLRAHRDQVLLLYLEDDMGEGHDEAAATLTRVLGETVYRPPAGGCSKLPLDLTRDDVLAAGRQVVIVSGCGSGAAWPGLVFDWSSRGEERPHGYTDFPQCGSEFTRAEYDANLIRYYEDSTALTAGVGSPDDGLTPETTARVARCGVDLTGFDQLLPDDGRLEAMVWSWAEDEPRSDAGDCSIQRADGRWKARSCRERQPLACRASDGSWSVARRCARETRHAVPRTGHEGQLLRVAMQHAGVTAARLGQRRRGESWVALDPR